MQGLGIGLVPDYVAQASVARGGPLPLAQERLDFLATAPAGGPA